MDEKIIQKLREREAELRATPTSDPWQYQKLLKADGLAEALAIIEGGDEDA